VHYRGEPSGAAVAAARRAGSPWPEQMDRKMLRFVEKRGVRTDKTKRLQRGQKCCQRLDSRFHYLSKCTVNCLDKSEQRWVPTDKTPPARTEVLSARGEESKPVAHPCRGPGGQAGDHQQRQGHPLSAAREPWLAPNVIGAWGVTTLSANRAGDDSWVAGIELATASEPPARRPRIWGVALRASTPATPELEPAFEPCRFVLALFTHRRFHLFAFTGH
jgi:hypothetical protein